MVRRVVADEDSAISDGGKPGPRASITSRWLRRVGWGRTPSPTFPLRKVEGAGFLPITNGRSRGGNAVVRQDHIDRTLVQAGALEGVPFNHLFQQDLVCPFSAEAPKSPGAGRRWRFPISAGGCRWEGLDCPPKRRKAGRFPGQLRIGGPAAA